ncbi:MAG: UPF0182 family protein [Thaumarchaeota archaeon]|nr:UPF0182 family protein [Nitrososphaerota archaeon]
MMYEYRRPPRRRRHVSLILVIIVLLIIILVGISQTIQLMLNFWEFGDLFIRPFYYSLLGGLILSFIAFFRLDFINRRSLTFWLLSFLLKFYRRAGYIETQDIDFSAYRLSIGRFLAWQLTKMIVGSLIFANSLFGMALTVILGGADLGLQNIPKLFALPFTPISMEDVSPALQVISASPALVIILPPIISALGIRLTILVGLTLLVKSISSSIIEYLRTGLFRIPVEAIEAIIALASAWIGFTLFFSSYIDYNTKVYILGAFALAAVFSLFIYLDKRKPGFLYAFKIKFGALILILLLIAAIATIQNSIADARKVEWLGPYVKQEIEVNRYLADISDIAVVTYNFTKGRGATIQNSSAIDEELSVVRLWDWDAAFTKLKPEIGLIPYVDFEDSDILRFGNRIYWSASMKPILPRGVQLENIWYNEHLVYTHVPNGFLLLDANNGSVVDPSTFFKQRRIYYGEGGLLDTTWAAIILGKEESDEITGTRYNGRGGVVVGPPITWLYDVTFLLSYPDKQVKLLRYRDVYDRLDLLLPYFTYRWDGEYVDMFPVTDGENTYWLMPLIVRLPADHVPWSKANDYVRFIGYALVDIYNGDLKLIIVGDDFVSRLIKNAYKDILIEEFPDWLRNQSRFPAEVFEYQVRMFNYYHIDDPATFIQAKEFYEIPEGVTTYFIIARYPGFEKPEFVGILSLQLQGSMGRNLAGFMIVRNDYPHLGEKIFYRVPIGSEIKLLGPSAAREALERHAEFRKLRTLLENPRVGDILLYYIGGRLVYIIPVYTSPAGGVVAQLGTIATIGAEFTGKYYIGLGRDLRESYEAFLRSLEDAPQAPEYDVKNLTLQILKELGIRVYYPERINANLIFREGEYSIASPEELRRVLESFIDEWVTGKGLDRVLIWFEDDRMNIGSIFVEGGVVELHYISITG